MRYILRAVALVCWAAALEADQASAAQFYRLNSGLSYDLPGGVSPDGSTVLTTIHTWTPAGGFVPYIAGNFTYSRDISNNGIVVGLIDGSYLAFRTPLGGPLEEIGFLPGGTSGNYSDAYGITPEGSVIVGYSSTADGHEAVRWTRESGMQGLGHLAPGNHFSDAAHAVSADGSIIVGQAESAQGEQAFRWTQATGLVGLGDLAGGEFSSTAYAISSNGHVIVGSSASAAGTEAFRWTEATGMVALGDLPGSNVNSHAIATTADGRVTVGSGTVSGSGVTADELAAFIWSEAGGMRRLQDVLALEHGLGTALTGWHLTEATDISDNGNVIVGYGRAPSGQLEGFVVIIPEPSAALLAVLSLVSSVWLAGNRKKRVGGTK
jgi:probable HAF family extracellular repeat protein